MIPHTPTPWQYTTNVGPTKALIVERDGSTVMEVRRTIGDGFPTNVAFIIRACNAHDELVAALELCERALAHNSLDTMNETELAMARTACRVALGRHEAVEASRAALAKASE